MVLKKIKFESSIYQNNANTLLAPTLLAISQYYKKFLPSHMTLETVFKNEKPHFILIKCIDRYSVHLSRLLSNTNSLVFLRWWSWLMYPGVLKYNRGQKKACTVAGMVQITGLEESSTTNSMNECMMNILLGGLCNHTSTYWMASARIWNYFHIWLEALYRRWHYWPNWNNVSYLLSYLHETIQPVLNISNGGLNVGGLFLHAPGSLLDAGKTRVPQHLQVEIQWCKVCFTLQFWHMTARTKKVNYL